MVLLEEQDDPPWERAQRRVPAAGTGATIEFCTVPTESRIKPYKRTPLLIAAYCVFAVALVDLMLGTGMVLIADSAGLAVILALAEIIVQVRRRPGSV
jgi:hypothetical protein